MDASVLGVLVAAFAVVASSVLQYVSIRETRRNTVSTLRASVFEAESTRLREALAEYLTLTYEVDTWYKSAKRNNELWPGDHYKTVRREDELYNLLRLYLDDQREEHHHLVEAISELRDSNSEKLWTDRREAVLEATVRALGAEVRHALGDRVPLRVEKRPRVAPGDHVTGPS